MDWELVIPMLLVGILAIGAVVALAAREVPAVRPWAVGAALAVVAMPVAIVLHSVLSALVGGEEAITFIIALVVAPAGITIGTLGAAFALRSDARFATVGASLALAGAGLLLFSAYTIFALVVTTLEGGNPPYQAPVESIMVPLAIAATVGGAILAVVTLAIRPRGFA